MMWWLAAAAGTFYLLFSKTATSSPVHGLEGPEGDDDPSASPQDPPEPAGESSQSTPVSQPKKYDPTQNPFRKELENVNRDGHRGSYDDILEDEPVDDGSDDMNDVDDADDDAGQEE